MGKPAPTESLSPAAAVIGRWRWSARLVSLWVTSAGLALVIFLGFHLLNLALALVDPGGFENTATALHGLSWLPLVEVGLAAAALTHLGLGLARVVAHRLAVGPVAPARVSRRLGQAEQLAALAARLVPWSGGVLLLFLPVHLAQLRWNRPPAGGELATLRLALAAPWAGGLYVLGALAVALHLFHGLESAHRSLGWLDSANGMRIRWTGRGLALVLGGGFALLALALRAGIGAGGVG
ncbi:MAG: succinate dehydrogenase [Cyanobacteriota bacterium]